MIVSADIKSTLEEIANYKGKVIITMSGPYGVGKDVYASLIHKLCGEHQAKIIRYADPLRWDFVKFGFSEPDIDIIKRYDCYQFNNNTVIGGYDVGGFTFREAMIKIAESNKIKEPNFYSEILLNKILTYMKYGVEKFIIPDMRFDVEFDELSEFVDVYRFQWLKLGFDIEGDYSYTLQPVEKI